MDKGAMDRFLSECFSFLLSALPKIITALRGKFRINLPATHFQNCYCSYGHDKALLYNQPCLLVLHKEGKYSWPPLMQLN